MNEEKILEQLNEIFQNVFDDDDLQITSETTPDDISDWDSLAQITIITMAEKKFNVQFSVEEIESITKVGDILDVIMERGH